MHRNNGYRLETFYGESYLLPYGQQIADHKSGVRLNETGVFLWNTLEEEHTFEELWEKFYHHFSSPSEMRENMKQDLLSFLQQLEHLGIICTDTNTPSEPFHQCLSIGGISICLNGCKDFFSSDFDAFSTEPTPPDLTIEVHAFAPFRKENGILIIRNSELVVCEREHDYLLLFPSSTGILEVHLKKDGAHADFYCLPTFDKRLIDDIFHGIRIIYLYYAQRRGLFALHSASILYDGKAWLFSGPSGTGKSTHTNFWHDLFHTPLLNGDLNLITRTPDGPMVYGMPWCGTSGICDTGIYPLGGIIFLKQAPHNQVEPLPPAEQALSVMHRLISPSWTAEQLDTNGAFALELVEEIYVARLHCLNSPSAAIHMKKEIDYVSKKSLQKGSKMLY